MPKIYNENTALKLKLLIRSEKRIKDRINRSLKTAEKIYVPNELDGCEMHNRLKTLCSFLSNESYVNEQIKTEDGKDNIFMLLHSHEVAMTRLKKLIRDYEDSYESEMEG